MALYQSFWRRKIADKEDKSKELGKVIALEL